MKLTSKKVETYMYDRAGELNHCPDCISAACNDMADEYIETEFGGFYKQAKPIDFMKLLFFNDPIPSLFTHNYGFHTATGRHIIETLKEKYYEYKN